MLNKQLLVALLGFATLSTTFTACSKKADDGGDDASSFVELTGNLSTQTLTADKKYLIKGQVFVRSGAVLTIQPGTVLYGEKRTKGTLVVDRGGKIEAKGTAAKPIVFTSNQLAGDRDRGDWGGLVILGNAACNQVDPTIEGVDPQVFFGGHSSNTKSSSVINDTESSGTLEYVRVEFAGIELTPNNETNSITLGGVGRGTKIEYCQVSYGGDDGFEWFGGSVNGKYLISFNMWDDDFDVDFGYSGNNQFLLAVRYPSYADQSGSNIFECDNGPNDNDVQPYTTGTFSNVTGLGPIKAGSSISNGNYQHAIDLRRRTAVSIANSVFTGMPLGVRFNQASVVNQIITNGRGVLTNNIILTPNNANGFLAGTGVTAADVQTYWLANNARVDGPSDDTKLTALGINPDLLYGTRTDKQYGSNPNFAVTTGTITSGAAFTNAKFNESNRAGFFQNVAYRGAFGSTDWTDGWAEFAPVDKAY
ncbi:MAG: hypothetical protein ACOVQE_01720 [Chitinophagaceae bacterium]